MKKLLTFAAVITLMLTVSVCAFSAGGLSEDPADSYVPQVAPNEDSDISLWFEPSFKKVMTSDTTPSGKNTYSVYMAKNETENAQFVLYSDVDKDRLRADVSDFTNENGDSIPAKLYYEMYVTADSINPDSILGTDDSSDLIRSGEIPDPVIPLSRNFSLVSGKSQAFFIKLTTSEATPSGWYSATLNIMDAKKNICKTATVYAYVWNFTISEKTELQTSFYLKKSNTNYKTAYDYLLENRLCAMDIPMQGLTTYMDPSNPYFTNERVSAIRVSVNGGGNNGDNYLESGSAAYKQYGEIYDRMKNSDIWETVKDKLYFYTADEPLPVPDDHSLANANDVIERANMLRQYWDDPRIVVPICEEHAYPNASFTSPLTSYPTRDLYDSTQAFMDNESITIWCPRIYAFTPKSEIDAYGKYNGIENPAGWSDQIRTMSGPYSSAFSNSYYSYFNWEALNGYYADRINSYMAMPTKAAENAESWAYSAGWNKSYSYCNHLIENTGIQTKMLFWQLYQEDVTGYLYYGTNNWTENDSKNGNFADKTPTGSYTSCAWKTNKLPYANGYSIYGNGVLFYDATDANNSSVRDIVGSLRVEIMRDGVEEYQMFKMLEDLKGESAAKAIVSKVSTNVVNYLSMPNFKAAEKPADIDNYDYMESVRRELGNTLEAASAAEKCTHVWDGGKTIKEATCLEVGETLYKCRRCDAEKTEYIPAVHTSGERFEVVIGSAATCTADSTRVLRCSVCGYEKRDRTKAFHNDSAHYVYSSRDGSNHIIKCDTCGTNLEVQAHSMLTRNTATCTESGVYEKYCRFCEYAAAEGSSDARGHNLVSKRVEPTCTTDGYDGSACTRCDYTEATVLSALGHSYTDGVCDICGESEQTEEPLMPGDINGDGIVNTKDSNMLKRINMSSYVPTAAQLMAADLDGDGSITTKDSFLIKKLILGA